MRRPALVAHFVVVVCRAQDSAFSPQLSTAAMLQRPTLLTYAICRKVCKAMGAMH